MVRRVAPPVRQAADEAACRVLPIRCSTSGRERLGIAGELGDAEE